MSDCQHTKYLGCPECGCVDTVTITISREDAEALATGPDAGQAFREASVRELEAIRAALEAEG